jgi:hypothetical protein
MDIENAISGGKLKEKVLDADDAQLIAMGKKPELQRVYNTWTRKYPSKFLSACNEPEAEIPSLCLPGYDIGQLVMPYCFIFDYL